MNQYDRYESLNRVRKLADRYVEISGNKDEESRTEQKEICQAVSEFDVLEAVYFCQQIVSQCRDIHLINMTLTVVANRVSRFLDD